MPDNTKNRPDPVREAIEAYRSAGDTTDPLGSWTGAANYNLTGVDAGCVVRPRIADWPASKPPVPRMEKKEIPVQDADDL